MANRSSNIPSVEIGESGIRRFHLNLSKDGWDYFVALIEVMRIELGKMGGYVNQKPQLPTAAAAAAGGVGEKFVELVLTNLNNFSMEVRFLVTNLCPVGIKIPGYTWFEFEHDGETYFGDADAASFRLPFSCFSSRTDDVDIATDLESVSDSMEILANLLVFKLNAAAGQNIHFSERFEYDVEITMAPIIRITSESLKFRIISLFVVACFAGRRRGRGVMPPWMVSCFRHWATLSQIWRLKDVDSEGALRLLGETGLTDGRGRPFQTFDDLDQVIELLQAESTSG